MPKYINADKIISHLNDEIEGCEDPDIYSQPVAYGTYLGLQYARSIVETAETADMQEVVRCKDCRFFDPYDKVEDFDGQCVVRDCETDKEEFCSYGNKRGDEK